MKQIQPDLWETDPEYPFPGLSTHAYLWTSAMGNVLFYNTTHKHEFDKFAELGGIRHQYLSHQDEIASSLRTIQDRFGATLHIHESEAELAAAKAPVTGAFSQRHTVEGILEVIPTPGHTPGSTCYVANGAGGRYLFTGDTIYRDSDGRWMAGYIKGHSDPDALLKTLDLLATLTPDIVISSAFAGDSGVTPLDGQSWHDIARDVHDRFSRRVFSTG